MRANDIHSLKLCTCRHEDSVMLAASNNMPSVMLTSNNTQSVNNIYADVR